MTSQQQNATTQNNGMELERQMTAERRFTIHGQSSETSLVTESEVGERGPGGEEA